MLITKIVKMKWWVNNKEWYENKGYKFTKYKDNFKVKVEDLTKQSHIKVEVKCDECEKISFVNWGDYNKCIKPDGTYHCIACGLKLYGSKKTKQTKLKNGVSFKQWCIENKRQDFLDRWDYKLNECSPKDILYGIAKKYYFKCPMGLHKSELKQINSITSHLNQGICNQCNSFAQYLINTYGEYALELYWNYDKNKNINPWDISFGSSKKVWIKCQEKDYHEDYQITCSSFTVGRRCPYCSNYHGKVHKLDSLGTLFPRVLNTWSDKNKKSPYEYSPYSKTKVFWKCPEGKHEDYLRSVSESNDANFRCPKCKIYKGEKYIEDWLVENNFIYINQNEYCKLSITEKQLNKYYISQMMFNDLLGINNGLLSYDFYLPDYNLLIEYQGNFHDGSNRVGNIQTPQKLKIQKEHDKRKKQYCINNKIRLLEIWYWDYDNIEEILNNEINKIMKEVNIYGTTNY